jgi:soluble lytic murein transglycosylase-like protein
MMRCLRIARGLGRLSVLVLSVAAISAIAMTVPASARSHAYPHRHYHFARRHAAPLHTGELASSYRFGFQPFVWRDDWRPDGAMGNRRITNNRWTKNRFNPRWQANGWSEQNSFNGSSETDGMAAQQASAAGVPVSLVERVIKRESGGNPRAVSRGNYGLMQIRLGTARAMGYDGSAAGLLDAQTNMTYAVRYLAGAYRAAGGNESRAVALYARGYYNVAKAQGFSPQGFSPYGGSYQLASNAYGAPAFGYQPTGWQAEQPYAAPPRYRSRHYWHRPV